MDTIQDELNALIPPEKLQIYEHEELVWLVSLLFTDKFHLRDSMCSYSSSKSREAYYQGVLNWVNSNKDAKILFEKTKSMIGDNIQDLIRVESWEFLVYAESEGYQISTEVAAAAEWLYVMEYQKKIAAETERLNFPPLSKEEFQQLIKEPLWPLTQAILYVSGVKSSQNKERIITYIKDKPELMKLCGYINSAKKIKVLDYFLARSEYEAEVVAKHPDFHDISCGEVKPEQFVDWVKTMPVILPMFEDNMAAVTNIVQKPNYITFEMQLMFDAIDKFWSHYDLANPNRHVAPRKDEVVQWLKEEASKRGNKLSDNLAKAIDSIIRCPESKIGGNTY